MNILTDYYAILGVPTTATRREIERAYRRLARQYHPDVNPSPEAHERMAAINEAYQVLRDPDQRAQYNQRRGFWLQLQQQAPLSYHGPGLRPEWPALLAQAPSWWAPPASPREIPFVRRILRLLRRRGYRLLQGWKREDPWMADVLVQRRRQRTLVRIHDYPIIDEQHITALRDLPWKGPKIVRRAYFTSGMFWPAARAVADEAGMVLYDGARLAELGL